MDTNQLIPESDETNNILGPQNLTVVSFHTLSVTRAGTGSGTVASTPSGINCGTTCSASFSNDTSVSLKADPAAGSVFAGWSGACTGTASTCTVTMDAAKSVTAAFNLQTYLLSVTKTGTGSGTVTSSPAGINCGTTCSASYNSGTSVTLTATADANSVFAGWNGDADCSDANVTMTVSKTCTASFTRIRFEETDPSIIYTGVWSNYTCTACSAGAIKISKNSGARATFTFTGTGVK